MADRGGRRSLLTAWSTIQAAMYPEGACDADERRAFEEETRESNARMVRWIVWVSVPLNALSSITLLRHPEDDPTGAEWILGVVILNLIGAAFMLAGGIVSWLRRPAALWRALGDAVGAVALLATAARSASSQRAHPNIILFVAGAFVAAMFLRMRPHVFVPALLGGAAVVLGGIMRFRQGATARLADELALFAVTTIALFTHFINRSVRVRELVARRQVERLNTDLERRVEAQVKEIVKHAREVEELNVQLNEKIRERSRELSQALARLAGGHGELQPHTVLGGRAEIETEIGYGGMGVVYRGRDLVTGKTVAIKVVQAGSANELDSLYRFLREAQAMASVTHDAIVRSIHVDVSEDGRLFQMMELVDGETLAEHLDRRRSLPAPVAARLGAVLAAALAAAHAAGVVHRDVKPSNVMLTQTAPGLKLLDFGISKLWDARESGSHTAGRIVGTPAFLSPEQVNDPANVAAPADVYALGLVLYLCIAGRLPFDPFHPRGGLAMPPRGPVDLSQHEPGVDPSLARAVMDCLQPDPGDRPTASAMADTLTKIADLAGAPPLEQAHLADPTNKTVPTGDVTVTAERSVPDRESRKREVAR